MKKIFLVCALVFVSSCASQQKAKKEVQEKISQEKVRENEALGEKFQMMVKNSKTLTAEKKDQLMKIFNETRDKNRSLQNESYKARSVLIQELLGSKVDRRQVRILKKRIRKSENERLKITLDAIDRISIMVAKDPERQEIMDQMLYVDRHNR